MTDRLPLRWLGSLALGSLTFAFASAQTPHRQSPGAAAPGPGALDPVAVLAGPSGAAALEVYDAGTGGALSGPGRLRQLELLPLDFTGRTQVEALLPERPQRLADLPQGAARLTLPFGAGTLYRYRRTAPSGSRYGLLLTRDGALPRVLFEREASGATEPFSDTVAVAPDGRSLLVATSLSAGGDLFEVPLDGTPAALRTPHLPPLTFHRDGLWLGRDFGFGVAPSGVFRFARTLGATASAVPGAAGATWTGQAIMNRARRHGLATTGADPTQREVWVFGASGAAVRASRSPAEIADAGFLPTHAGGPWLALSDDGSLAAWVERTVVTTTPLVAVRDVRLQAVTAPVAGPLLTGDTYLLDTLDEVASVLFFRPFQLLFAAGEVNDPTEGGVATADYFSASLDPQGQPVFQNLTLTSGDPTPPFDLGIPTLTPGTAYLLPGGLLALHDEEDEALLRLDLSSGAFTTVENDVKELDWFVPVGSSYCAAVRRRNGTRATEILRFPSHLLGAPTVVDPGGQNVEFLYPIAAGSSVTWVRRLLAAEWLERADLQAGTVERWSATAGLFAPPLGLDAAGNVRFARQAANGVESRIWRHGAPDTVLLHPLRTGHWLP